ncbi:hypothetical protein CHCC20441_3491 [Bacillus licheniformis]|uniref:Uncharacterized protein n=1 Tax=Bacillus licheniformis TaxID=1402 RepID=A0A8B5YB36_BACLI|nr:hypothetical protein MUY_001729 [Bacillus licheniformis WX-02]EQM28316.1 hypothetical protein N399_09755 [Bacillus licheniformis CG-B52]KUL13109.1 hypothetical protein LI17339_01425 [Bacillus licheniformis LMG 17339]KYC70109.1 hypothetical protein B4092_1795 [Bacillus licheniformis]KYC75113.1 hypothetical protein B4090_1799 [Bacillus licheniformis]
MKQMNRKLFKRAETLLLDEHQKKAFHTSVNSCRLKIRSRIKM